MGIPKSSIIPVHGRFSVFNNEYFYKGVLDYNESRIQATYGVLADFGIYLLKNYLPEGGFHICDAGTAEEDSVTLKIALGINPARKRYILISDR